MDMDVLVKTVDCSYIVKFYGALFWEGDLWIFMEIMDSSLDKFYRQAYETARKDCENLTTTNQDTKSTTSSSSSPSSTSLSAVTPNVAKSQQSLFLKKF